MKLIKKIGSRFTTSKSKKKASFGLFLCPYCKKEVEKQMYNGLVAKSCGCSRNILIKLSNTVHGASETKLHRIWSSMKERCSRLKNKSYSNYGGRGISVCEEWEKSFIAFRDWAFNNGYSEKLEIDRRDNDGNYNQQNCRWVTHAKNSRNKRNIKMDWNKVGLIREEYSTGKFTQKELGAKYCIGQAHISSIVNHKAWIV